MKFRNLILVLPLLLSLLSCGDSTVVTCSQVDALVKVFPENTVFRQTPDTLDAAGATHVEFQFALHAADHVEDFTVECGELVNQQGDVIPAPRCGVVGYVGVGESMDYPAHDVLKSATGMYPDPILEQDSYDFEPFMTFCPWITVYVPAETPAGVYSTEVIMKGRAGGRGFTFRKKINVKVWPVTMREPEFKNVNWAFDFESCMKLWNGGEPVERYSEDHRIYLKQLYGMLSEAHQTMTMMPVWDVVGMTRLENGKWEFDFTRFDWYVELCKEAGILKNIQIEEIGHRLVPSWTSPMGLFVPIEVDGKMVKENFPPSDPRVREFYSCFIPALKQHLEEAGWSGKSYHKICDEPIDENSESYKEVVSLLREYWPDIRVLEALQTTKTTGATNAWCPQLNYWHEHYDFFKERQEKGDEVWFYTCCYPHEQYPNRFIEQPLLKTRMIFWMGLKYKADGYLHWGFNFWNEDPYAETSMPGTGTMLPGGDAWIIYPSERKMLRSIRFEQYRDGMEDLTLVQMLAEKEPATAEYLVNSLITNWWVYAGNPNAYRSTRRELLKALSGVE